MKSFLTTLWSVLSPTEESFRTYLNKYILLNTHSEDEEAQYQEYIYNLAWRSTRTALIIIAGLLIVSWPTDYIYFQDPDIQWFYVKWRSVSLLGIGMVVLIGELSSLEERPLVWLVVLGIVTENFLTGYWLGFLKPLNSPWFGVIYLLPVISIGTPGKIGQRSIMTLIFPLAFATGWILPHPEYWSYEHLDLIINLTASSSVLSIVIGHTVYTLLRLNFFRSQELEEARKQSDELLVNILPEEISEKLKADEEVAEHFEEATVLFADIVKFTPLANRLPATEVVNLLDDIFSSFDRLVNDYGLEKIKTIGDEYFVAAGVPRAMENHAVQTSRFAFEMQRTVEGFKRDDGNSFKMRMGMNSGPLVAGIIGEDKFAYDVWGNTVNLGSRMESQGVPGAIQISPATKEAIERQDDEGLFTFEKRGTIEVKGKERMTTYFLKESS